MSGATSPQTESPQSREEPESTSDTATRGGGSTAGRAWRAIAARPLISAIVVVVVIAAVVSAFALTGGSSSSAAAGPKTTTTLTSVATGTVKAAVSTTGTFTAADTRDVSFGSAAEITSVQVALGDKVTQGQVLGTIATVGLKQTLAQARATLANAESTLASAQDSSDSTDTQLAADKASVTSAKSAVTDARTALADATLTSPIAGTVAAVNVATGTEAGGSGSSAAGSGSTGSSGSGSGGTAGGSTTGGSTTGGSTSGQTGTSSSTTSTSGDFVIVGGRAWTVSATVDDTEVGLLAKNDQAQITTDNVTGTVFGTVSSVGVLSSGSSTAASYPVTIAVTGSPSGLHDGASATISIIYKQVTNVLTVPTTAVQTEGTTSYVYVSKSGTKTKQTVTTGLSSGGTTQITSGLTSGEQVYVTTIARTAGTGTRSGSGVRTGTGGYPGGGTGNFPGGRTGNVPGGGTGFGGGR